MDDICDKMIEIFKLGFEGGFDVGFDIGHAAQDKSADIAKAAAWIVMKPLLAKIVADLGGKIVADLGGKMEI